MRLGVLFLLLGTSIAAMAAFEGGFAYVLFWLALVFIAVGVGYLGVGSRVFGKRADGSLPIWSRIVFAPYLGLAWIIWQMLRRTGVRPHTLVSPGLYLARRLHARELPADVEMVVDLTAEFAAPAGVHTGRIYHALPALDGHVPEESRFRALVDEVALSSSVALVHCAAGHGRSAGFVAAVLIRRGLAANVDEAEKLIKQVRPSIRISKAQRALVARIARR